MIGMFGCKLHEDDPDIIHWIEDDKIMSLKYDYDGELINDGLLNYKVYGETPEEREKRRQEDKKLGEEIRQRKKEQVHEKFNEELLGNLWKGQENDTNYSLVNIYTAYIQDQKRTTLMKEYCILKQYNSKEKKSYHICKHNYQKLILYDKENSEEGKNLVKQRKQIEIELDLLSILEKIILKEIDSVK